MVDQNITISPEELRAIMKEYEYSEDVFNEDDDRVVKIKHAISLLQHPDQIVWCLYMDLGASRKVGKVLGVSHSTILKEINRIKSEIRFKMMEL